MTSGPNASLLWSSAFFEFFRVRNPEPLSKWADAHRVIADGASPEPGPWRTDRVPYFRDIMDAVTNPRVRQVAICSGIQLGKTELLLNAVAYYSLHEPSPILFVEPSEELARDIGRDRIDSMIKASPEMRRVFGVSDEGKVKTGVISQDTKRFQGGYIKLASAASPTDLTSRPIRIVLCDEVDKYPQTTGENVVDRAIGRATNFVDKKIILVSSPGELHSSEIWRRVSEFARYEFRVPCQHCGEYISWRWDYVKWDKDADGKSDPETARIVCPTCGGVIRGSGTPHPGLLSRGEWFLVSGSADSDKVGYQISGLYSPWQTLSTIVSDWLQAVHTRDVDRLRVFIEERLAEPWEARRVVWRTDNDLEKVTGRFEEDPNHSSIRYITAGVDVQRDRVEVSLWGFGPNCESWALSHTVISGDPLSGSLWTKVLQVLAAPVMLKDGRQGRVYAACVDSGDGYSTSQVYQFCAPLEKHRVVAVKGVGGGRVSTISAPTRAGGTHGPLYRLGVDRLKQVVYDRLGIPSAGPGYMHIPTEMAGTFWEQLTAEHPVTSIEKGRAVTRWEKTRERNEALDCCVYALAAFEIFCHPTPKRYKYGKR